jgi:hypothetical protein
LAFLGCASGGILLHKQLKVVFNMNSKFTLKIAMLFLVGCFSASAQTVVKVASAAGASGNPGITNLANAYDTGDTYLSSAARITSTASSTSRYLDLSFTSDVPANTPVYIKVGAEYPLLQGLVAGALGNAITGLVDVLVPGTHTINVAVRNSSNTANLIATNGTGGIGFTTEAIKVVINANGEYFIRIKHSAAFKTIRLTNTTGIGLATTDKTLDVFGGFYTSSPASCSTASYTSYTAGGLLTVVDVAVTNPQYAIDADLNTASALSLGVVGVGESTEQMIYFDGTSIAGDKYLLKMAAGSALLSVNAINGITVTGYNGTSTTPVYTQNLSQILALSVNTGALANMTSGAASTITLDPGAGVTVDRLAIRLTGVVAIATSPSLFIYDIHKDFSVTVAGGGNVRIGDTVTLTSTLNAPTCGTITYAWSGPNGVTGSGTSVSFPAPTTAGTYSYTVVVTDSYGVSKTVITDVVVLQPPVGGTANSIALLCTNVPTTNLTLTGATGDVVRWEKSTDATFATGISNITTTATFLTPAQIGTNTQTTYFRALLSLNGYTNVYSTIASVGRKSTTWNGTAWSNGAPDFSTVIYIDGAYNQAVNLNGCELYVISGAVSIPTNYTVHLVNGIHVQAGSFVLQNDAHLMQDNEAATNDGNITLTRNSSNLYRQDYTFWSSPVVGQQLKAFSPATLTTRFYTYGYNPATLSEAYLYVNPETNNFQKATTYLIRMPNIVPGLAGYDDAQTPYTFVGLFTGVPNNGVVTKALSTEGNRYTGVGNPFPSPINVRAFFNTNASVLETGSAIYFWRKKNNANATSYATLTYDLYTYNHAVGGNPGEEQFGGGEWGTYFNASDAANWVINPGQGFLVRTSTTLPANANPQLTFNAAMRRADIHNNQFFRVGQTEEEGLTSRIWIDIAGSDAVSQSALVYSNTATLGLDYARDAESISTTGSVALWSNYEDKKLVVQARPAFTATDEVPMGYKADTAGQYTISIYRADGVFAQGQEIYLVDNLLGTTTNITTNGYAFTTDAGTFADRFRVVYSTNALGTDSPELTAGSVIVYQQNNAINITSATAEITEVNVFDVRGRKLYSANNVNANETAITGLAIQQQVIIVEVTTAKGKVSKKIVY